MDKIQQCEILEKLIHILSMDKHDFFSSPTSLLDRFINLNLAFFMKSYVLSMLTIWWGLHSMISLKLIYQANFFDSFLVFFFVFGLGFLYVQVTRFDFDNMIDRKDLCFYKQIQAFCLMTSCFGCISWVFLKGVLNSIFWIRSFKRY